MDIPWSLNILPYVVKIKNSVHQRNLQQISSGYSVISLSSLTEKLMLTQAEVIDGTYIRKRYSRTVSYILVIIIYFFINFSLLSLPMTFSFTENLRLESFLIKYCFFSNFLCCSLSLSLCLHLSLSLALCLSVSHSLFSSSVVWSYLDIIISPPPPLIFFSFPLSFSLSMQFPQVDYRWAGGIRITNSNFNI